MRNIKQKRINFIFSNTKLCRHKTEKSRNTSEPYKNWNLNKSTFCDRNHGNMQFLSLARWLCFVLPLFPSLLHVIAPRSLLIFAVHILLCAHVCMPHSLKVDRLVLFATFAEKPRLNADFLVFTSAKSNTIPQNNRTHIHTHVRAATRSTNTKFQDG